MTSRMWWGTVALLAAACAREGTPTGPREVRAPLFEVAGHEAEGDADHFGTRLAGRNEVPPHQTRAKGHAIFRLSDDGNSVKYKLIASNIDNPFMAHIHMAPKGANGPIVEWLFPSTAPVPGPAGSGRHDGVLAEGTFTAANFVGPLKGHALADLIAAIGAGKAYVNVHTLDGVHPPNSGPGNFPGGEIRGQLPTGEDR